MSDDNDFSIVRRCQSADADEHEPAFRELYELYKDRVYNTAFRVVGNASDAADVCQDVFLTVFRKIGEFQFSSRFFTWIYRITVNLSIDRKRRERGGAAAVESDGESVDLLSVADASTTAPESWADVEFVEQRVQHSIQRLSPKLRAIVVLRYIEDLSYGDIADVMNCSIGTVKSRLNRAHRNLEVFLKPVVEAIEGREEVA